jgi:hypothetical protein
LIKGEGKGGVVAFAETNVRDIIVMPINNSRSFMGEPPIRILRSIIRATGSLGIEA